MRTRYIILFIGNYISIMVIMISIKNEINLKMSLGQGKEEPGIKG